MIDYKINIIEIDFIKAYLEDHLVVHFRVDSERNVEREIRVRVEDPFFGSDFFISPTLIKTRLGINFWASFRIRDIMADPILGYTGGFVIIFEDVEEEKEVYRRKFENSAVMYTKRMISHESPYDAKRLFMIGDSHIWTNFGQHIEGINKVGEYTLVRHVMYKVSSFSFWSGDFEGYLKMLPVEKGDALLFCFGTYDFRRGAVKMAKKRGISVYEMVYQTLFQKLHRLKKLREKYPDNPFVVCSIVPPIRSQHISEENKESYFYNSSDEERMEYYRVYRGFWERHPQFVDNLTFLDWTEDYVDDDGFCKNEMMRPDDIHVGNFRPALKKLEEHLEKIQA
jgi:hypothetical protein